MKCPRCQQDNPPHAEFCLQCGTPLEAASAEGAPQLSYADVRREAQRLTSALEEAAAQQTATSEILRIIGASPGDVQPVFDAIARSCVRLCQGVFGGVFRFDGELIHLEAQHNFSPDVLERYRTTYPRPPGPESIVTRTVLERRVVHVPDIAAEASLPLSQSLAPIVGFRSAVSVPMLRHGRPVGAVAVARAEPGGFSERQIALLEIFADQAVIAIENMRLFKELRARNRDLTATSEILQVISSSPTDAQPVFDAIAESALRLCEASFSNVIRYDGELLHQAANAHVTAAGTDAFRQVFPLRLAGRRCPAGWCSIES